MPHSLRPKHWPKASYDPHYDPLVDAGPGHNRDYAPTYWIDTAGQRPEARFGLEGPGIHVVSPRGPPDSAFRRHPAFEESEARS